MLEIMALHDSIDGNLSDEQCLIDSLFLRCYCPISHVAVKIYPKISELFDGQDYFSWCALKSIELRKTDVCMVQTTRIGMAESNGYTSHSVCMLKSSKSFQIVGTQTLFCSILLYKHDHRHLQRHTFKISNEVMLYNTFHFYRSCTRYSSLQKPFRA